VLVEQQLAKMTKGAMAQALFFTPLPRLVAAVVVYSIMGEQVALVVELGLILIPSGLELQIRDTQEQLEHLLPMPEVVVVLDN